MDAASLAQRAAELLRAHAEAETIPTPPPVLKGTIQACDELQQVGCGRC
jgi:hypothetical protein